MLSNEASLESTLLRDDFGLRNGKSDEILPTLSLKSRARKDNTIGLMISWANWGVKKNYPQLFVLSLPLVWSWVVVI